MSGRPVYGRIYELRLRGQAPDEHPYVGMTTTTIHRRVHGPNGHASPESIRKDPWKARILSSRAGYRLLETVYDTGHPDENDRALRRAEAFWIDRLRPTYNEVRPVRPFGDQQAMRPHRQAGPRVSRPVVRRSRRRVPARAVLCLLTIAFCTFLAARVVVAMELPWPAAPWVAAPAAGTAIGWSAFWRAHRSLRKLLR